MLAGITFNYMFSNMVIYLFGFAMSATELESVGELAKKFRWAHFSMGVFFMIADLVVFLLVHDLEHQGVLNHRMILPLMYFLNTFGRWGFVLGLMNVAKDTFTTPKCFDLKLR